MKKFAMLNGTKVWNNISFYSPTFFFYIIETKFTECTLKTIKYLQYIQFKELPSTSKISSKNVHCTTNFLGIVLFSSSTKMRLEKFGSKLLNKYKVLGLGILIYILPVVHSQESKCIRIHKYSLWCHCHPHQIRKYENVF